MFRHFTEFTRSVNKTYLIIHTDLNIKKKLYAIFLICWLNTLIRERGPVLSTVEILGRPLSNVGTFRYENQYLFSFMAGFIIDDWKELRLANVKLWVFVSLCFDQAVAYWRIGIAMGINNNLMWFESSTIFAENK